MSSASSSMQAMSSRPSPELQFRVVRKRNRVPLSCAPCRQRKLKCDRTSPCQNCMKRAEAVNCVYAASPTRKRSNPIHTQTAISSSSDVQNRIDRLEGLVLSLMTNGGQSAGPSAASEAVLSARASSGSSGHYGDGETEETQMLDGGGEVIDDDSDTEKVTKSFGIMKVDNESKKTHYYGEGHWATVLHDIAEVRNYFQTHKKHLDERMHHIQQATSSSNADSGPALLFGTSNPPPRSEILTQLPSKYLTDILIAHYFDTFDPNTHVIHGPTFQKVYEDHWADPSGTSIVWVAMLFAMLRIALLSYIEDRDEPPEFAGKSSELSNAFSTAMANCLILANSTKPHQYLIETLIFHLEAEYRSKPENDVRVWVLVGIVLRLAMRMGYHRDSKMFPVICPFEGEMRRRAWAYLRQADIMFSFHMSLPGMIRIGDSDTELPRNLYDEEVDNAAMLPPSRPMSEPTTVSYLITKSRLAFGFGRVLEEVNSLGSERYDEILKIDKGLREIFEAVPSHLQIPSIDEQRRLSITDVISRYRLAAIYHKSQCVLHRRFLRVGRNNAKYAYNRRTCLQSAMALLNFQSTMHRETRDNGRLKSNRPWFTSLAAHDFFLAATAISTAMYQERQRVETNASSTVTSPRTNLSDSHSGGSSAASDGYGFTAGTEYSPEDLLRALEESKDIWTELRDESMDAYKASEILTLLLTQLTTARNEPQLSNTDDTFPNGHHTAARGPVDEKQNAAMTLGLLSSGGKSPNGSVSGQPSVSLKLPGNSIYDSSNGIEGFLQPSAPTAVTHGGRFDGPNPSNGPLPFLGMFGNGGMDMASMNLDWDAFESYAQSSSLGLDPASALWSSLSPNVDPIPADMTWTIDGGCNVGTAISSNLDPQSQQLSDYDLRPVANLSPSDGAQRYGSITSDPPVPGQRIPSNEAGNPGQRHTGVATAQVDTMPGWRLNKATE